MYKLIRPVLFSFNAESVHDAVMNSMQLFSRPFVYSLVSKLLDFEHPALHTNVLGIDFANPVGLAAGYDKSGRCIDFLASFGFGFIEVGTVTPRAQVGNPKPRLFHLPSEKGLFNRMGFNNEGVQTLAARLRKRKSRVPVGANIGKNKETPLDKSLDDYCECFEKLAPLADYIVINVSSPNTPGLRDLQKKAFLQELLGRLQGAIPVFVKIAPELSALQLDGIMQAVTERTYTGIIATNTVKQSRADIGEGGLSGRPLAKSSTKVIRYIYDQSKGYIPIIGVGGIFSAEDAYEKIRAGASLIQIYTGFIYEGPRVIARIKQGLVKYLQRDGFASLTDAVGKK